MDKLWISPRLKLGICLSHKSPNMGESQGGAWKRLYLALLTLSSRLEERGSSFLAKGKRYMPFVCLIWAPNLHKGYLQGGVWKKAIFSFSECGSRHRACIKHNLNSESQFLMLAGARSFSQQALSKPWCLHMVLR